MLTAKDATRPDDLMEFAWTFWPEDVLEAIDMLLVYLGYNKKIMRPPTFGRLKPRGESVEVPMKRVIHTRGWAAATTIVHPQTRKLEGVTRHWFFRAAEDVKGRLASAGINVDTVQVQDEYRWALTWYQLHKQFSPRFSQKTQEELVQAKFIVPKAAPVTRTIKKLKSSAIVRITQEREQFPGGDKELYAPSQSPRHGYLSEAEDGRRDSHPDAISEHLKTQRKRSDTFRV